MADQDSQKMAWGFWTNPRFCWALVVCGLALLHLFRIPSLPVQIDLASEGMTPQGWMSLGGLLAASVLPALGLWQLSPQVGLPRFLSFLFPVFPLAIAGIYLVWPMIDRIRRPR